MQRRMSLLVCLGAAVLASLLATPVRADEPGPADLDIWKDPTFQKQFLGSYGFQSELEPAVTELEREQMQEIIQLMQDSNLDGAAAEIEEALTARNRRGQSAEPSAVFDFTLGNIRFQQDRLEEAARHYENALKKFPGYRRAYKNLGLVQVRLGRFEGAIKSLSRVVSSGGADGLTYGLLGYSYSSTEQYVSAESAYRNALLLEQDVLDWKLGLTLSVLRQQKYGEAEALCRVLVARFPDRADFWKLQANAFIGLGQPLKAAENYEILHRMGKADPASLYNLGDIYVNEGLWDLAERAYRLALENGRDGKPDRSLRNVKVLAQRGALDQARSLLQAVKSIHGGSLNEDERKDLLKLEARMVVAEGGGEEATEVLEEIVSLDPLDGEALILLGRQYAQRGEFDRAIFYLERAGSIDEFEAEAKIRLAQVLVDQSRYDEAVPLLKRAQEIEPRGDVARFLEQVQRVARAGS